jgi:hypothetical protein
MNSYKNSFRNVLMALLGGAMLAMPACKKEKDEPPIQKHSTPYYFGNTNKSAADFFPLRTTPPKSPILLSADSIEVEFVVLTLIKDHPKSDADGSFSYFSPNGIRAYLNDMLKPALEALGPKGKLSGVMDLKAETYDATAAERAIMEAWGMKFSRVSD